MIINKNNISQVRVAVIVPVYNAEKIIAATIQAIAKQTVQPSQIFLVDDGSTDQSAAIIQTFSHVSYLYQENKGPAAARNQGARLADADFLMFTDADCVPEKDWIYQSLLKFNDESIAAVAGSYSIANPHSLLSRCIHYEIKYRHQHLMPAFPAAFGSFNVCIRRQLFFQAGGFPENFVAASGEDNALSYAIGKEGFKITFAQNSLVAHFHTEKLGRYLKEQYRHGYWRAKLYRQYPEMMKGDDYTFWKDILEPPWCLLICLLVTISILFANVWLFVLFFILGFVIEFYFANKMYDQLDEKIYATIVFIFRAFARTTGFVKGVFC